MTTPENTGDATRSAAAEAAEALGSADTVARQIRSRRRWYVAGALVLAVAMIAFTVMLAAWPERLAEVIVPGLIVVGGLLALLAWGGRTIPTAAIASTNRALALSAVLLVAALLLIRFVLPEGFSVWVVLVGLLPGLPLVFLAWRVGRE